MLTTHAQINSLEDKDCSNRQSISVLYDKLSILNAWKCSMSDDYERSNKNHEEKQGKLKDHVSSLNSWKLNMKSQFAGNIRKNAEDILQLSNDIGDIKNQIYDITISTTKHNNQLNNQIETVSFITKNMEGLEDKMQDNEDKLKGICEFNSNYKTQTVSKK